MILPSMLLRHEKILMIITVAVTLLFISVWHSSEITESLKTSHLRSIINLERLVCGENEATSLCVQNECIIQMCSEKFTIIEDACGGNVDLTCEEIIHSTVRNCSKVSTHLCKKGCVCKSRYLRDFFNTCIPEENCSW